MKTNDKPSALRALAACALLWSFLAGCENADSKDGVSWNGAPSAPAAAAAEDPDDAAGLPADEVPFSSLSWTYGRTNGANAQPSEVSIAGLSMGADSLRFGYTSDLSSWGLASTDASAIACLFVQRSDGSWVGGKFDFISSSRTFRSLTNVMSGYGGWSLSGVPNPCQAAFVIIDRNGSRRSNVISATWSR